MRPINYCFLIVSLSLLILSACTDGKNTVAPDGLTSTPASLLSSPTSTQALHPIMTPTTIATDVKNRTATPTDLIEAHYGALLVRVYQVVDIGNRNRQELWILDQGTETPRKLLADNQFSYESPVWSNNGEWLSYLQRDIKTNKYKVGIIQVNGDGQQVFSTQEFFKLTKPLWSWDDKKLVFGFSDEEGFWLIAKISVENAEISILRVEESQLYEKLLVVPSPTNDQLIVLTRRRATPPENQLWVTSVDQPGDLTRVKLEDWNGCEWFSAAEWAPDGESILLQPGNEVVRDSCPPMLWQLQFDDFKWHRVATMPNNEPHYLSLKWLEWSRDTKWVLWKEINRIVVIDSSSWSIVQTITLQGNQKWLTKSFVENKATAVSIAITEFDYSQPPALYKLLAVKPDNLTQENHQISQLSIRDNWLPEGFDYIPDSWQPLSR